MAKSQENTRAQIARDFQLGDRDFQRIVALIGKHAGINLGEAKRNLVYGRLVRRLRSLNIASFEDYIEHIEEPESAELEHFINSLTTNLTSFYRERHHFDFLREHLLPELSRRKKGEPILAWSAGCSTGEEPYSIAMTMADHLPDNQKFRILATDLDSSVVAHAAEGIYPEARIEGLDKKQLQRWFLRGTGSNSGMVRVRPELRDHIAFRQLNLMQPLPIKKKFDFIFCRNVIIYFNKETQRKLFDRLQSVIADRGHIFIGHSESLYNVTSAFEPLGNTVYKRVP